MSDEFVAEPMDEFTAHKCRRDGVFCPRRDGKGNPCSELLTWREEADGAHLCCSEHGRVFAVERAA